MRIMGSGGSDGAKAAVNECGAVQISFLSRFFIAPSPPLLIFSSRKPVRVPARGTGGGGQIVVCNVDDNRRKECRLQGFYPISLAMSLCI